MVTDGGVDMDEVTAVVPTKKFLGFIPMPKHKPARTSTELAAKVAKFYKTNHFALQTNLLCIICHWWNIMFQTYLGHWEFSLLPAALLVVFMWMLKVELRRREEIRQMEARWQADRAALLAEWQPRGTAQ